MLGSRLQGFKTHTLAALACTASVLPFYMRHVSIGSDVIREREQRLGRTPCRPLACTTSVLPSCVRRVSTGSHLIT